jgi:hypothetical protein
MNSQDRENWKDKVGDYEVEVQPIKETTPPPQLKKVLTQIGLWYNALPTVGKLAVVVVGVMLGLSLLASVFRLVTAVLTLTSLGIILYLVYRFFIASRSSTM